MTFGKRTDSGKGKEASRAKYLLSALLAIAVSASLLRVFPITPPAQAQVTKSVDPSQMTWIELHDDRYEPPIRAWVNMEKAERIRFYTGSYNARRNVPQCSVSFARYTVTTFVPKEIELLRRYVQQRRMR